MISSFDFDDLLSITATEKILSNNASDADAEAKSYAKWASSGGSAFAACRSQGHQSHWSAFEPLSGTSVLNNSSAGVSGLVDVSEERCKSNRSVRDRLSCLNLFWKKWKMGMRRVFILLIIIHSSSILLTI